MELTACPLLWGMMWFWYNKLCQRNYLNFHPVLCQWPDEWLFWKSQVWTWSLSLRPCLNLHVQLFKVALTFFKTSRLFPCNRQAIISLKCPNAGMQINLEDCCKAAPIRFAWGGPGALEKHCCRINKAKMQRNCCKIQQQWLFAKSNYYLLGPRQILFCGFFSVKGGGTKWFSVIRGFAIIKGKYPLSSVWRAPLNWSRIFRQHRILLRGLANFEFESARKDNEVFLICNPHTRHASLLLNFNSTDS